MKAITFIRTDSKRLPNKSVKLLGDTPLYNHTLRVMNGLDQLDDVIVYASDESIVSDVDKDIDFTFLKRDTKFDKDSATFNTIMDTAINEIDSEYVLYFCVTSPFIKKETVSDMIDKVLSGEYDSSFPVKEVKNFCWYDNKPLNYNPHKVPLTQNLQPVLQETSGLYIFKKNLYKKYKRRIGYKPYLKVVSEIEGHDIDYPIDFTLAEYYLEKKLI
jgi:CMP-N-acetylneuraminic acid synthetase|tara:strand:- start:328 stop:975 length:648 start_codon:yes stop_codon:yes gene_type:complete